MKKIFVVIMFLCLILFPGCGSINQVSKKLDRYDMVLSIDTDNKVLIGNQSLIYTNKSQNCINEVLFHLYPNAFRKDSKNKPVSLASQNKAYPNGMSYGEIEITGLYVNDCPVDIILEGEDKDILKVEVGELFPDDNVKISIDYRDTLPNCIHRYGYGDNTINFGNFYPIVCVYENGEFFSEGYSYKGDPFYSDIANYNVKIIMDSEYILASTGQVCDKVENNNRTTYSITANAVRDFAFVISKDFNVISNEQQGVKINYYFFDDEKSLESLNTACASIKTFNELFGEYPYEELDVVQADFLHGGMEYPNLVYISHGVVDYDEYTNVIVHEIAHQWWYGLVGNNQYDNSWQDEGLAEVSTLLFYEYNKEYNVDVKQKENLLAKNYAMFLDVYKSVYGSVDERMNRSLDEFNSDTEYVYIAYVKANIMFCDIKNTVGTKRFIKSLSKYYKENRYTNCNPDVLIDCFENVCGKQIGNMINSYLNGEVVMMRK